MVQRRLKLFLVAVGNDIRLTASNCAVAIVIDSLGSVLPLLTLMAAMFAARDFGLTGDLD
jgi:hypothetical protein